MGVRMGVVVRIVIVRVSSVRRVRIRGVEVFVVGFEVYHKNKTEER